MYGYDIGPQDWLFMLAMMSVMTVLTVVVVIAIVRAVRSGSPETPARSILDQRFARGEISTDEYVERKRHLDQK
jgi:putative membrane protein